MVAVPAARAQGGGVQWNSPNSRLRKEGLGSSGIGGTHGARRSCRAGRDDRGVEQLRRQSVSGSGRARVGSRSTPGDPPRVPLSSARAGGVYWLDHSTVTEYPTRLPSLVQAKTRVRPGWEPLITI